MATATRSTRKSTRKSTKANAATAKPATAKKIVRKPASKPKAKPAAAPKRVKREQDSVTATMIRGKRDYKSRAIDTDWMPASNGGVRFEEETDNGRSPHFMTQDDFASMGEPRKIRVTVKALA